MNNKSEFIQAVHQKIREKKRMRVNLVNIGISIVLVTLLMLNQNDDNDGMSDELWSFNEGINVEMYEWEYIEELSAIEILSYLIDGERATEFIDFAENNEDLLIECFEIDEVHGTLSGTDKGVEYKIQVFIPAKLLRERLPKTLEIVRERYLKVYKDATDKEIKVAQKSFIDFVELAEKIEKEEKTSCEFYASF